MKLPAHIKANVDAVEAYGHALVSQGCAMFRCIGCRHKAFLDVAPDQVFSLACVPKHQTKTRFHGWLAAVDSSIK